MEAQRLWRQAALMAGRHTRVNVLVEGQTEETFVRELLAPHLVPYQVYLTPRIIETSKGHRGGVVSYGKIEHQLRLWCRQDSAATVTTLLDIYGLPSDFPGLGQWNTGLPAAPQAVRLEACLAASVARPNLIPHLQLHEYEALLFSDVTAFDYAGVSQSTILAWQNELAQVDGPEDLNNSPRTSPSKRLIARWPEYAHAKPLYGALLAIHIGLDAIRDRCPHFDQWVTVLENL